MFDQVHGACILDAFIQDRICRYTYINIYSIKRHYCDQDRYVSETVQPLKIRLYCILLAKIGHRQLPFYVLSLIICEGAENVTARAPDFMH